MLRYPRRHNVTALFVSMFLGDEDKILIYHLKEHNVRQFRTEFPDKGRTISSINWLLKKFRDTGSVDRRYGNDRPLSAQTDEDFDQVNDIWFWAKRTSPELTAQSVKYHGRKAFLSHLLSALYERICSWNALRGDVRKSWLQANCGARKLLLKKFSEFDADFVFFTDEKVFTLASAMKEMWQVAQLSQRDRATP